MSLLRSYLEANAVLTPADLEVAVRHQQSQGGSLDTALLELGLLTAAELDTHLSKACGLPTAPARLIETGPVRPWSEVPKALLDIGWAMPLAIEDGHVLVAVHPDLPDARLGQLYRQIRGFMPMVAPECCLAKLAAERSHGIVAPRFAMLVLDVLDALHAREAPLGAPQDTLTGIAVPPIPTRSRPAGPGPGDGLTGLAAPPDGRRAPGPADSSPALSDSRRAPGPADSSPALSDSRRAPGPADSLGAPSPADSASATVIQPVAAPGAEESLTATVARPIPPDDPSSSGSFPATGSGTFSAASSGTFSAASSGTFAAHDSGSFPVASSGNFPDLRSVGAQAPGSGRNDRRPRAPQDALAPGTQPPQNPSTRFVEPAPTLGPLPTRKSGASPAAPDARTPDAPADARSPAARPDAGAPAPTNTASAATPARTDSAAAPRPDSAPTGTAPASRPDSAPTGTAPASRPGPAPAGAPPGAAPTATASRPDPAPAGAAPTATASRPDPAPAGAPPGAAPTATPSRPGPAPAGAPPGAAPTATASRPDPAPTGAARPTGDTGTSLTPPVAQDPDRTARLVQRLAPARAVLAQARERDRITEALVHAAAQIAPRVALFGVKREGLRPLAVPGGLWLQTALVIPIPEGGLLDRAVLGHIRLKLLTEPKLAAAVGRPLGIPCLFEPVFAQDRGVLMLYIDRDGGLFDAADHAAARELCDLAGASLEALLRLRGVGSTRPTADAGALDSALTAAPREPTAPNRRAEPVPGDSQLARGREDTQPIPSRAESRSGPVSGDSFGALGRAEDRAVREDGRAPAAASDSPQASEQPRPASAPAAESAAPADATPAGADAADPGSSTSADASADADASETPATDTDDTTAADTDDTIAAEADASATDPEDAPVDVPSAIRRPSRKGKRQVIALVNPIRRPDTDAHATRPARPEPEPAPVPEDRPEERSGARVRFPTMLTPADDRLIDPAPEEDEDGAQPDAGPADATFKTYGADATSDPRDTAATSDPRGAPAPGDAAPSDADSTAASPVAADADAAPTGPDESGTKPIDPSASSSGLHLPNLVAPPGTRRALGKRGDRARPSAPEPALVIPADLRRPGTRTAAPTSTTAQGLTLSIPTSLIAPAPLPGAKRRGSKSGHNPVPPGADAITLNMPRLVRAESGPRPSATPVEPPDDAPPALAAADAAAPADLSPGAAPADLSPGTAPADLSPGTASADLPPETAPTDPPRGPAPAAPDDLSSGTAPAAPDDLSSGTAQTAPDDLSPGTAPDARADRSSGAASTAPDETAAPDLSPGTAPEATAADPTRPAAPTDLSSGTADAASTSDVPDGPEDADVPLLAPDAAIDLYLQNPGAPDALAPLRRLGADGLARLAERFPGPIDLGSHTDVRSFPPPSAHGPLLRACVALGAAVTPHILDLVDHPRPQIRFYAAFLFQDLRDPRCLRPLAAHAFDPDADVRLIATRVLESYSRSPGFVAATEAVRAELRGRDRDRALLAAEAAGTLRDTLAVPILIDLLSVRDKQLRETALEALCSITAKHHGYRPAKWRAWFDEHGAETRIEWVIDALRHRDAAVRRWAADELVRVTGHRVALPPDGEKLTPKLLLQGWLRWWDAHGADWR